jgi:uncharacterized membrane protein YiaA
MVYITLTHIVKGIIEFYHGVYHISHSHTSERVYYSSIMVYITVAHILKGIIKLYHGVYHTHKHPKGYNRVLSWYI